MADGVFNIAKGRVNELHNRVDSSDPTNAVLVIMLLKVAEADATLVDYDTFTAILAGSNTEADFTNYARKTLSDSDVSTSVTDDSGNTRDADIADQTWSSAGGASNNTLVKLIIGYAPDSTALPDDSTIVPLCHYDFSATTDGNDLQAVVNASGYFSAS
jgi:hypothetical protein